MASVVSVTELPTHPRDTATSAAGERYRKSWLVKLDGQAANGADLALAASGIPADGAVLSGTGLSVVTRSAEPEEDSGHNWIVTAIYGADPVNWDGSTPAANPWSRRILRSFGVFEYSLAWLQDFSATPKPVRPSSGTPFDPPPSRPAYNFRLILNYARRSTTFDPWDVYPLIGKLNSSSVSIRGKTISQHKGLIRDFNATEAFWRDNTAFYNITVVIEVEREVPLRLRKIYNESYYELATADDMSTRRHAANPVAGGAATDLVPVNAPIFLNANGTRYTGSNPQTDCVLEFVQFEDASWSALNL